MNWNNSLKTPLQCSGASVWNVCTPPCEVMDWALLYQPTNLPKSRSGKFSSFLQISIVLFLSLATFSATAVAATNDVLVVADTTSTTTFNQDDIIMIDASADAEALVFCEKQYKPWKLLSRENENIICDEYRIKNI